MDVGKTVRFWNFKLAGTRLLLRWDVRRQEGDQFGSRRGEIGGRFGYRDIARGDLPKDICRPGHLVLP
jgi:hypothetical protein